MPPRKKPPYDDTFRFRGFKNLGERIARIVAARGYGDASDVMREGIDSHVREEERRLGLEPLTASKITAPMKRPKGKKH